MTSFQTECRCGTVSLKVSGKPAAQLYCHCDDCQNAHRAAYVPVATFPAEAVEVLQGYPYAMVVKSTERIHCSACGAFLFSEIRQASLRWLSAYLLPKGTFAPEFHVQCQHALLPVIDTLPHYKGFPATFGGAEEFVDW